MARKKKIEETEIFDAGSGGAVYQELDANAKPIYDDGPLRLEMVQILTKRLPELWDKYIAYMNKNDMAQGRLKPDWPHFINWLKEYYN